MKRRASLPAAQRQRSVRVLVRRFFRAFGSRRNDADVLVDTNEGKYHVGEKWNYRTRPGEEDSLLTVLKVESSPKLGVIVHVSLDGLRIENPGAPGGVSETIGHLAFAEAAIDKSVTTRAATGVPVPADDERYERASFFTVTVAETVHLAELALSQ
jgi:hypothetical protein